MLSKLADIVETHQGKLSSGHRAYVRQLGELVECSDQVVGGDWGEGCCFLHISETCLKFGELQLFFEESGPEIWKITIDSDFAENGSEILENYNCSLKNMGLKFGKLQLTEILQKMGLKVQKITIVR